jgi:hypothetical protein
MITIGIDNLEQIQRQFAGLGSDLPKAIAAGINKTAEKLITAEKDLMRDKLDRPTPFTLNSLASYPASPNHRNPSALVFVKPIAAAYLQDVVFGGVYGDEPDTPEGGLHPGKIRLNRYGNIPNKKGGLEAMAKKQNQFVGRIKTRRGQEIYGLFERYPYKRKPKPWRRHRPALARPMNKIKVLVYASKSGRTEIMPFYRHGAEVVRSNLNLDVQTEVLRILRARGYVDA